MDEFARYHRDLTQWVLDETYKAQVRAIRHLLDELERLHAEVPQYTTAELIDVARTCFPPVP